MPKRFRGKKLIKWSVQGPIITRLLGQFLIYNVATICLMIAAIALDRTLTTFNQPDASAPQFTILQQLRPMLIALVVMLPIMVWELLKLTNRIAGPLYRFELLLRDFVRTGQVQHAQLRKDDLTQDMKSQFNEFVDAMHALYPETCPESREPALESHNVEQPDKATAATSVG